MTEKYSLSVLVIHKMKFPWTLPLSTYPGVFLIIIITLVNLERLFHHHHHTQLKTELGVNLLGLLRKTKF